MPSPVRKLQVGVTLCGLAIGATLAVAGLTAFRGAHAPPQHPHPHPTRQRAQVTIPDPPGAPSPAALDAEWQTYGHSSSCVNWAGADGTSSIRISPSKIAWFFSDTYLGPVSPAGHSGFLNNSIVVQTTSGGHSTFATVTGGGACVINNGFRIRGDAVVRPPDTELHNRQRYWDADGLQVGSDVLKFYNRFQPGQPPFVPLGTVIARFPISQLSAATPGSTIRPQLTEIPTFTPVRRGTPIVWGSAVLRTGDTVYVYGWQAATATAIKHLYLARVPVSRLTDVGAWRFYAGGDTWTADQSAAQPVQPPGTDFAIASGFSVVKVGQRYWVIQQDAAVGSPDIDAYPADTPWGPFDRTQKILLYRSPDTGVDVAHDYRIMYEARVEPSVSTPSSLVISYNVNTIGVDPGCKGLGTYTDTITRPRFIAVPRGAFSATTGAQPRRYRVVAGPSPYADIAKKNPSQWFNGWDYPSGCPPVPGVVSLRSQTQADGSVSLSWASAGLDVLYRVYGRPVGPGHAASYTLMRTVSAPTVDLGGYARHTTYQWKIVPANIKQETGPPTTITDTIP